MSESKWYPLFFDKYAYGDRATNNNYTKVITENVLNESDDYYLICGEEAVACFNNTFSKFYSIPQLDKNLYNVRVYHKIKDSNIIEFYTLVDVNSEILKHYVEKKITIPNVDFLQMTCRYHHRFNMITTNHQKNILYGELISSATEKLKNMNIEKVINTVTKAVTYDDNDEIDNPEEISEILFRYQKCSIHWMVSKEKYPKLIRYNINDEIQIGDVCFDYCQQTFNTMENRKQITFYGGGIIDEVGLGKTLQITTLAVINQPENCNYVQKRYNKRIFARSTLIVCPTQLCGQWKRELQNKISAKFNPTIISILSKTHYEKYTYQDILDADFVIVSFTFFDNKVFTDQWVPHKNYQRLKEGFEHFTIEKKFEEISKNLTDNTFKTLGNTSCIFPAIHWQRFVVDEFHEVYTNPKYMYVKNILPHIKSNYRWCVTATPFSHKNNLYHMVNFLSGHKNDDKDLILTNDDIIDHLLTDTFRRNTKSSVKEEHSLPPIKEEIRWLKFTSTERMMYNAFLANPKNDKFSVYLRQLCCHPKLADETKHALSNCRTLKDIEKTMISHYEKEMNASKFKYNRSKKRVKILVRRIQELKQYEEKKHKKKLEKKIKKKMNNNDSSDSETEEEREVINDDTVSDVETDTEIDDLIPKDIGMKVTVDVKSIKLLAQLDNNENYNDDSLEIDKTYSLENMEELLKNAKAKALISKEDYEGKKTTFLFFQNVVTRIKKTMGKTKKETDDSDSDSDEVEECGICMDDIPEDNIGVTKCGHIFCYDCLKTILNTAHKCPYCNRSLGDNDIFMMNYEVTRKITNPEMKKKMELINEVGTKLANLIFYLRAEDKHTIIFSQWDDLLHKVGKVLKDNGIQNVFCKGNVFQRDKAIREFSQDDKIKVIMLSSKSAASGTNLTKAERVILIDPVYGSYKFRRDTESQAIGRAHRIGQKNSIKVVRFIIRDSVEEEIYNQNKIEDKKHQEKMKALHAEAIVKTTT